MCNLPRKRFDTLSHNLELGASSRLGLRWCGLAKGFWRSLHFFCGLRGHFFRSTRIFYFGTFFLALVGFSGQFDSMANLSNY